MKDRKGFTLIELLAVIVILGLLMAIAIPSVTRYITQSRRKTLVKTMDSYITAVMNSVNNGDYKFYDPTKIFAVPIECISLEKGGTDPFGEWYQANELYWGYVLVSYDDSSSYSYGFTFKDSAGYGLYPTVHSKITNSLIRTGYDDLTQPQDGLAINFVTADKWDGFDITSTTELVVLEAESEGVTGDNENTCTLYQKGSNYDGVEQEKMKNLSHAAQLGDYVEMTPTSTSYTPTNCGITFNSAFNPSELNVWRVIKKNSDGTIELVSDATSSTLASTYATIGIEAYNKHVSCLNEIAKQYENEEYTIGSRAMGYNGQTETLSLPDDKDSLKNTLHISCPYSATDNSLESIGCGDTLYENDVNLVTEALGTLVSSDKKSYLLASRYCINGFSGMYFGFHWVSSSTDEVCRDAHVAYYLYNSGAAGGTGRSLSVRPIVILKSNLKVASGDGTKDSPWVLE